MRTWTFEIEIVTPLFLSGASPETAELRPNTIKNLMRWWYRAAKGEITDVKHNSKEFELFGSTENAGKFIPKIIRRGSRINSYPFGRNFNNLPFGVQYLAFPFRPLKRNNFNPHRSQIKPTTTFEFSLNFLSGISLEEEKAVIAAFWLLVFLGGLGSRSRRGFGSIIVNKVKTNFKQDSSDLQFCYVERHPIFPIFFQANLQKALDTIGFLPSTKSADKVDFTTFASADSKIYLWKTSFDTWEDALDKAGILMGDFRYYLEIDEDGKDILENDRTILSKRNKEDYWSIKNFLKDANKQPKQYERAAFGLPINIRYKNNGSATVQGGFDNAENETDSPKNDHDRRSSPLFIKVLKANPSKYALLFIYLPSKLLADGEKIQVKATYPHKQSGYCEIPDFSIVEEFLNEKVVPNAEEISF